MDFANATAVDLLRSYAAVLEELQRRQIIRTQNVLGDYAEWLVAERLGLTLQKNSTAAYDAVDAEGRKYQIKGRKATPSNPSRQLSAIRNLAAHDFDFLIALLFQPDFSVQLAVQIPYETVLAHAKYKAYNNAHVLHLQGMILKDAHVQDITHRFDT